MATVEIDEVQLMQHRQLAQTVDTVMRHPQARLLVQQAHKIVNPNAVTPELDQQAQIRQPYMALNTKLDTFIEETKKDRAEREKTERLQQLKNQFDDGLDKLRRAGWTPEGIAGVEKLMQEKGLLDPLDAAAIFEKTHPPQQLATPSGTGAWNFADGIDDGQVDLKKMLDTKGGNDQVVDKMAREALNDFRNQVARR